MYIPTSGSGSGVWQTPRTLNRQYPDSMHTPALIRCACRARLPRLAYFNVRARHAFNFPPPSVSQEHVGPTTTYCSPPTIVRPRETRSQASTKGIGSNGLQATRVHRHMEAISPFGTTKLALLLLQNHVCATRKCTIVMSSR